MRNHNDKTRDIARSVLPSTARKGARSTRSNIHGSERAHERKLLHDLVRCDDPDDYDAGLGLNPRFRRGIADMVHRRRSADKVGPLIHWAERTVERDPGLRAASPAEREIHFRRVLPPGLVGDHAITHLRWVLNDPPFWWLNLNRRTGSTDPIAHLVEDIIGMGLHGELNRRIRAAVPPFVVGAVHIPPTRLIDEEHPPPGMLAPGRSINIQTRNHIRFLTGAHDIDTFAYQATPQIKRVVRELHAATFNPYGPTSTSLGTRT